MPETSTDTFLTVDEVAQRLRVNPETIRRWLRSGRLAGVNLSDKAGWRISEAALAKFLDEQTTTKPRLRPESAVNQ